MKVCLYATSSLIGISHITSDSSLDFECKTDLQLLTLMVSWSFFSLALKYASMHSAIHCLNMFMIICQNCYKFTTFLINLWVYLPSMQQANLLNLEDVK